MVLFPAIKHENIEIITGCMFSGKTEELISRIKLADAGGLNTVLFKPGIDKRYHDTHIVSHKGSMMDGIVINNSKDILNHLGNVQVIGIDEAQFFDIDITDICNQLALKNYRLIIAGLDKDFTGRPFGLMPQLISMSKKVSYLNAICHQCGEKASFTFKKIKSEKIVEIGENDIYEARCLDCYQKG